MSKVYNESCFKSLFFHICFCRFVLYIMLNCSNLQLLQVRMPNEYFIHVILSINLANRNNMLPVC